MPTVTMTQAAENFIASTHQFGRLLPQTLQEHVPLAESISIDYGPATVGGLTFNAVQFVLRREGYADVDVLIHERDMLSFHPQTNMPLFRAEKLVQGVILPKLRAAGWPEE